MTRLGHQTDFLLALVLVSATLLPGPAFAQSSSIWTGVYTAEQAERGKANFATSCVRCHGPDLGGVTAPALSGARFMTSWENENVYRLFVKIRDTMPPNFGTALTDEAKLDVVAYILQANAFPPGSEELKIDADALESIAIVRKGAGSAVPNFALVQVVGCLTRDGGRWTLTHTTEPAVTKDEPSTPESLKQAAARALGRATFRLVSVGPFEPDSRAGHKVEVKGLLYREPSESRLNVTSLETLASSCE